MKQEYKKYSVMATIIFLTVLSLLYIINNNEKEYELTTGQMIEEQQTDLAAEQIEDESDIEDIEDIDIEGVEVPIYICGQVNNPDVYYLPHGTILKDAIIAAGGFTDEADREVWNLAMEIQEGEKIYVPKVGEQIDKTGNSYDNRVVGSEGLDIKRELININKANAQELTSLPGIGPTIAQNIIDYREANGEFKTLQDVTNVSRIGQGTLEKIKDYICFQ